MHASSASQGSRCPSQHWIIGTMRRGKVLFLFKNKKRGGGQDMSFIDSMDLYNLLTGLGSSIDQRWAICSDCGLQCPVPDQRWVGGHWGPATATTACFCGGTGKALTVEASPCSFPTKCCQNPMSMARSSGSVGWIHPVNHRFLTPDIGCSLKNRSMEYTMKQETRGQILLFKNKTARFSKQSTVDYFQFCSHRDIRWEVLRKRSH